MKMFYLVRFVFVSLLGVQALFSAATVTTNSAQKSSPLALLGTRAASLVIFNDVTESYLDADPANFPFPWTSDFDEEFGVYAMTLEMMKALCSNQAVLCTATLWHQLQFFARMWDDFAHNNIDDLILHYGSYGANQEDVKNKIRQYRKVIYTLNQMYPATLNHISQKELMKIVDSMELECDQNKIESSERLYTLYAVYRTYQYVIDVQRYQCYDVNDWYLLFVPVSRIHHVLDKYSTKQITSEPNLSLSSMVAGLCLNLPVSLEYREYLSQIDEYRTMVSHPSNSELGEHAVDAVDKIMVNKNKLKPNFSNYVSELLPKFNILMIGHGLPAQIDEDITIRDQITAGIKTRDVVKVLDRLNNNALVQSVSIGSCFIGGKGVKNIASLMEQAVSKAHKTKVVQELTYPVVFAGSFFSEISLRTFFLDPFAYSALFYDKTYKHFFDALTLQDPSTKLPPPNYLKAMHVIFDILDDQGLIKASRLNQYVSIKFPGSPTIYPYDYDKRVTSITPIIASYKDVIKISDSIRIVLINTDMIVAPVEISGVVKVENDMSSDVLSWLTFLPVNYRNQNYRFSKIIIPHVEGLRDGELTRNIVKILQDLFLAVPYHALLAEWMGIQEYIYIVIDSMEIGDVRLLNVCLSVSELKGTFELHVNDQDAPLSYEFEYKDGKWPVKLDKEGDVGVSYQVWVNDNIRGTKSFEWHKFAQKLQAVLKSDISLLPGVVAKSRETYENMSPQAKEQNIFRKNKSGTNIAATAFYPKGLNPYAQPFHLD